VAATQLGEWRGTRATLHAADLSWQVSAHTLPAQVARYVRQDASAAAHVQALSALEHGLQTQATVLALQDVGALLLVILVGSGIVLGLGALAGTRRARAVMRRIW
jgi:uncharacterized membrane protein